MRAIRARLIRRCCAGRSANGQITVAHRARVSRLISVFIGSRLGSEFLPTLEEGNLWIRASMPPTISFEAGMPIVNQIREILLRSSRSHYSRLPARPPRRRQRRRGFFQCGILRAAEAVRPVAAEYDQGQTDRTSCRREFSKEFIGIDFNFSQYIQDNVEEGLSGVKGANSVKVIGPDLANSGKDRVGRRYA